MLQTNVKHFLHCLQDEAERLRVTREATEEEISRLKLAEEELVQVGFKWVIFETCKIHQLWFLPFCLCVCLCEFISRISVVMLACKHYILMWFACGVDLQVRMALEEAEYQLEQGHGGSLVKLQPWLQLTYEIESQHYEAKKEAAEKQLMLAKEMVRPLWVTTSWFCQEFQSMLVSAINSSVVPPLYYIMLCISQEVTKWLSMWYSVSLDYNM